MYIIPNLILLLGLSTAVQATPANSAQNSENNAEKSSSVVVQQFLELDWRWVTTIKKEEAREKAKKKSTRQEKSSRQEKITRESRDRIRPST
jgi:hypothetical protein